MPDGAVVRGVASAAAAAVAGTGAGFLLASQGDTTDIALLTVGTGLEQPGGTWATDAAATL